MVVMIIAVRLYAGELGHKDYFHQVEIGELQLHYSQNKEEFWNHSHIPLKAT